MAKQQFLLHRMTKYMFTRWLAFLVVCNHRQSWISLRGGIRLDGIGYMGRLRVKAPGIVRMYLNVAYPHYYYYFCAFCFHRTVWQINEWLITKHDRLSLHQLASSRIIIVNTPSLVLCLVHEDNTVSWTRQLSTHLNILSESFVHKCEMSQYHMWLYYSLIKGKSRNMQSMIRTRSYWAFCRLRRLV